MATRRSSRSIISLYGPPGVGKSRVGERLAGQLHLPFWDVDEEIRARSGMDIPAIFDEEGETGFRRREKAVLHDLLSNPEGVLALGGGALLDPENRDWVESAGPIVCLQAPVEILLERLNQSKDGRPLLVGDMSDRLQGLLTVRSDHYASFPITINAVRTLDQIVWEAQIRLGKFHVSGMGQAYDVHVQKDSLDLMGEKMELRGLHGPIAVVSDEHTSALYANRVLDSLERAGYAGHAITIPAGEAQKNMQTVAAVWDGFLKAAIERGSTVVALGGGVVTDLAGFAAATFLRGVAWVAVPTSLLAMVDASLGGKTGVDLPQGKNLVGAFHPPRLVLADPLVLFSLPEVELRSGLAEVVKAGVIADQQLFTLCSQGWGAVQRELVDVVRRAVAVKISVIEEDPYEKGRRASLNLGHTIGHAIELVSGFSLRHGEAVAIGMVAEARLAERLGIAQSGLADEIRRVLNVLGLPVEIPPALDRQAILAAMQVDKKRHAGSMRFALPAHIGDVKVGVEVNEEDVFL